MKGLVLAGAIPQIELIKKLRERFPGIEIILADYSEHPVAEPYADKFYRESTLDIDAIERIAVEEHVDFLMTVCTDQALNTVALVSEKLGLPCYIDSITGKNVTNKRYMKEVFQKNGIPTAKHMITEYEIAALPEGFRYPIVVKPVDCNSSKGVVRVDDDEALEIAVRNAIAYSRTDNAILEEFVDGIEVSVDVFVNEGQAVVLNMTELGKIKDKEKFIINRGISPAKISNKAENDIKTACQKIVDAFHLKTAPMLVQLLCDGDDIRILEFSARTGGGLKFKTINMFSGVDVIDEMINATFGEPVLQKPVVKKNRYVITESLYCLDGIFDKVEGFRELKDKGTISDYYIYRNSGEKVGGTSSSGDRVAGVIIAADTEEELINKYDEIRKTISVLDIQGADILRKDLFSQIEV